MDGIKNKILDDRIHLNDQDQLVLGNQENSDVVRELCSDDQELISLIKKWLLSFHQEWKKWSWKDQIRCFVICNRSKMFRTRVLIMSFVVDMIIDSIIRAITYAIVFSVSNSIHTSIKKSVTKNITNKMNSFLGVDGEIDEDKISSLIKA